PLLRGTDPVLRATAAEALGRMKSPRVGAALVGALNDRNDAVRRAAVRALADLHEQSAVAPLERLLLNDPDPEVQRECARALGELRASRSLDPLARALADPDVEVQRAAANAIGELEDVTNAPAALVRATTSPDLDLRRHASAASAQRSSFMCRSPKATSAPTYLLRSRSRSSRCQSPTTSCSRKSPPYSVSASSSSVVSPSFRSRARPAVASRSKRLA